MKKSSENTFSEKENKKVITGKKPGDNEVREGQGNSSIYNEPNDKSTYPYKNEEDKQHKEQPEFIENIDDVDTKDKA